MTEEANSGQPAVLGFDLKGKRVAVVGGKSGAGLGIAQAAQAAGASVVVASRQFFSGTDRPELAVFEQITLDVEDEDAVREAFKAIGTFDHLVVAAGPAMGTWGSFSDTDMSGLRRYTDSKFLGAWACARYASDYITADGSITFLTGGTAVRSKVGLAAVTSVFSAVEALGRSLALELGPVRVNTLRAGFIDTPFWDFLTDAEATEVRQKVREKFPVHRVGTAADIGHAAVFLMTNPYVTGTVIEVSGGELLVDWVF